MRKVSGIKKTLLGLGLGCQLLFSGSSAWANPVPAAMVEIGTATYKFLFLKIYTARLYALTPSFTFPDTIPFALELTYQRSISKEQLLGETLKQWALQDIEPEALWLDYLDTGIVAVEKEDTLLLFVDERQHSTFYLNGEILGTVADPDFSKNLAAIWLSDKTVNPDFTAELSGLSK